MDFNYVFAAQAACQLCMLQNTEMLATINFGG
jgi:hypothetical protein